MSEQANWVESASDSGSPERVAYDLWYDLHNAMPPPQGPQEQRVQRALLLYAECRKATMGLPFDVTKLA